MSKDDKISPLSPIGKLDSQGRITLDLTIPYSDLKLTAVLGEGAYGTVYQGQWKNSEVAIKKLKVQKFSSSALEEFRQEAQIMFQLGNESDHIVRLKKICLESPNYSLVMELMPKGSLYDLLHNNQDLPWPLRYQIAMDVTQGLDALHGYHILHRDLKSLNVLLGAGLRAKLSDFGLSKIKQETASQSSQASKGTPQWMAPELFKRGGVATKASDIYSLGMVLWELVTRAIPFADAANQLVVIGWIKDGEKETIPADCPVEFSQLITDCWGLPLERPVAGAVIKRLTPLLAENKADIVKPVESLAVESLAMPLSLLSVVPKSAVYAAGVDSAGLQARQSMEELKRQGEMKPLQEEAQRQQQEIKRLQDESRQREQDKAQEMERLKAENEQLKRQQVEVARQQEEAKKEIPLNPPLKKGEPIGSPAQNPFVMMPAPKPAIKVDAKEVSKLLQLVAEGEQDQAEALIKQNPQLLLAPGKVTDLSGRTFQSVTAFQYALWALDWHMWTMIKKYLPPEAQKEQFITLETKETEHGKQYDIKPLIDALQTYVDNEAKWHYDQRAEEQWCKKVGGAQKLVPVHVVNEYARPDRAFDPCPSAWESKLPRTREMWMFDSAQGTSVKGSWFVSPSSIDALGTNFAFYRGSREGGTREVGWASSYYAPGGGGGQSAYSDLKALQSLWKERTGQFELLKSELTTTLSQSHRVGVDSKEVAKLLDLVAEGKQDQAEALIQKKPQLLLAPGKVTDLSGRTFQSVTAFQYALWALDWHMWKMILKYMPQELAAEQLNALEAKGLGEHGKHFSLEPLIKALQTFVDNAEQVWNSDQRKRNHWCKVVGGAQTHLPVHVLNEYCRADRAFYPCPSFMEEKLPRGIHYGYLCGISSAFHRADGDKVTNWEGGPWGRSPRHVPSGGADHDLYALQSLAKTRMQQLELLKSELTAAVSQSQRAGINDKALDQVRREAEVKQQPVQAPQSAAAASPQSNPFAIMSAPKPAAKAKAMVKQKSETYEILYGHDDDDPKSKCSLS